MLRTGFLCSIETVKVSNKASWFEEKDWKSYWQRVLRARQEQPPDIQLPCLK